MRSMSSQISKKYKYFLVLLILIIIGIVLYKFDTKACKDGGFERANAEINANQRLSFFEKNYNFKNMKLQSAEKNDYDNSWNFSYMDDAKCEVAVNVDNCGATDISGFSAPCLSSKK
jgi:hypothetical protein